MSHNTGALDVEHFDNHGKITKKMLMFFALYHLRHRKTNITPGIFNNHKTLLLLGQQCNLALTNRYTQI